MVLIAVAFVAGLPRSLWCIPAFILIWSLSGASSGGSSGGGSNIGYLMLPFVVLGVALWGVYSNIQRASTKAPADTDDPDVPE